MRMRAMVALLVLLTAGTAGAQLVGYENEVGISFAPATLDWCGWSPVGGIYSAWLVIVGPTYGVAGWECSVEIEAPATGLVLNWELLGSGPIDIHTPPNFMVGLGVPFPRAALIAVARVNVWVADLQRWWFYVRPLPSYLPQSVPGAACYAAAEDVNLLVPLPNTQGSYDLPVATIFGCDTSAAESATWGAIKGMFD